MSKLQMTTHDEKDDPGPLLRIEHLKKYFKISGKGLLYAVDDVSLDVMSNETLGLVGESGCGKSTIGKVLMRLMPATAGTACFEGMDMVNANKRERKELTRKAQMIFQDPYSSLNPRKTVRSILSEPFKINGLAGDRSLDQSIEAIAERVGLEKYVLKKFPHELDGGKRQMVGIARALSMNPRFVVCDEPVSSLDVSVQATIINLLIEIQKELKLSYLFISHDLSVVRHISNRVAVMYLGQIVESAPTDDMFRNTLHPYSIALLSAVPRIDFEDRTRRIVLAGDVPSPMNPKLGCRFAPRCWMARELCKRETPVLTSVDENHAVACHYWQESRAAAADIITKSECSEALN